MRPDSRNPNIPYGRVAAIVLLALASLAITTACVYPGYWDGRSGRGGGGHSGGWHHGNDHHDGHGGHGSRPD